MLKKWQPCLKIKADIDYKGKVEVLGTADNVSSLPTKLPENQAPKKLIITDTPNPKSTVVSLTPNPNEIIVGEDKINKRRMMIM